VDKLLNVPTLSYPDREKLPRAGFF